jgi:glycosyltransferase involved in cell wall biosynthesis
VRLLVVAPWGERAGGAEEMLWTMLRHLDREQVELEVGFLSPGPFVDEVASLGIPTWSLPATRLRNPVGYARTVSSLAGHLRRARPDVALAWSAKAHLYLGVAALPGRSARRVLWWQHAIATGHWLERLATLIPADGIGCSSRACEEAQRRLAPHRATFVVYPGVELEEAAASIGRDSLGIDDDSWVVGIVGRLQPWKGQDRVIRAVADLNRDGVDAVALVVGGSAFGLSLPYAGQLERLAGDLGVPERVVFTGQVPDARPYYPLMDVVVNASEDEPFGIVVVEAMAAGRPVVAFTGGGPAEIVEDGESGVLTSPDLLAASLARLHGDRDLAARIASNGRERARSTFGAEPAAAAFADAVTSASRSDRP